MPPRCPNCGSLDREPYDATHDRCKGMCGRLIPHVDIGVADLLAAMAREQGRSLTAIRQRDGSCLIYVAPGAKDLTGLLLTAAMELDAGLKP